MSDQVELKSILAKAKNTLLKAEKAVKKLRREIRKAQSYVRKAPRKRNAYILFCMEMRPYIVQEFPGISPQQVFAELGRIWREHTGPEERATYKQMAEMDGEEPVQEEPVQEEPVQEEPVQEEPVDHISYIVKPEEHKVSVVEHVQDVQVKEEVKEPDLYVHSPFVHYCASNSAIPWHKMTYEQKLPFMMAHWAEKERRVERGLDPNDPKFQMV